VTNIVPTLMIAPYGWDSKDFNVAGYINWKVGSTAKPEFKLVSGPGTDAVAKWVMEADMKAWAAMITDGTIKRVEVAVRPELKDAAGQILALDMVSKTFDLAGAKFVDYYKPIVSVDKCNKCHDALATTFHTPDRGGNVVGCRMCHTGRNAGGHLEMASRSIDSYVHAIHSMQPFDIGDVDFTDPVEALHVEHHVASTYPNFTLTNCESCHNPGTYNVPDQAKSLPGILSRSDTVADRAIADVPSYVVGPASRACGGCHRARLINEDNAAALAAFNEHTANFGTQLDATTNGTSVLDGAMKAIRAMFE
jgi:OmcA/MtrC family decaheme c-type cytochrome